MKLILSRPFSRKTFDTYNILRKYYATEEFILIHENGSLACKLVLRLLYGDTQVFQRTNQTEVYNNIRDIFSDEKIVLLPLEESDILEYHNSSFNMFKSEVLCVVPCKRTLEICRNKLLLSNFCSDNGISVPRLFSIDQVAKHLQNARIIAKPIIGSGSRGINILRRPEDFDFDSYERSKYIFQELIPDGEKIEGCFALCSNGEVLTSYCHRRIKTYPRSGGVTVHSKYNDNQTLEELTSRVVKKLSYSGLLMIEYLFDYRDNSYKLIEINPRLWGSILLSESSGTKMLHNYVNLALDRAQEEIDHIESSARIRWLFPYGISLRSLLELFSGKTVFINISYTNIFRAILFHILVYIPRIFRR